MVPPSSGSPAEAPWSTTRSPIDLPYLLEAQKRADLPSTKIQLEVAYLKYHPFRLAWIAWLLSAFLLLIAGQNLKHSLLPWGKTLAYLGLLLLIIGFAARVYIAGRPPVTNMYESILWVAFGAGLFAVIFSIRHRSNLYLIAASPSLFSPSLPPIFSPPCSIPPSIRLSPSCEVTSGSPPTCSPLL